MNNFVKRIIDEKFASKAQQRYFYAQAGKGGKKGKKWAKWAKEFSSDTDFDKIPEKVKSNKKEDFSEIVDEKGVIKTSKKPPNLSTKGVTEKDTTDNSVPKKSGMMGNLSKTGTGTSLRYWAENKEYTKKEMIEIALKDVLGFEKTMAKDLNYDKAKNKMEKEYDLDDKKAEEKLNDMGYDENLDDGQVRLVENPKKFIEEFIESIINQKSNNRDLVKTKETEIKEITPIIKRQISSFNETLKSHNLSINDVLEYFNDNE